MNNYEKVVDISQKLDAEIRDKCMNSYKEFLDTMTKFHKYSFNNCVLINMQRPDATYVASYDTWKKQFKRQVLRGEKGLKIITPCMYETEIIQNKKDADGKYIIDADGNAVKEKTVVQKMGFKVTSVFDYSQTTGNPLPQFEPKELQGNIDQYDKFMAALTAVSPVPVSFEAIAGDVKGYYSRAENKIVIRPELPQSQTVKTMIHEIAHSMCDAKADSTVSKSTREVRAESVAYICCKKYGIDTEEYSFPYITGWASDMELPELKDNLRQIQQTATQILDSLDKYMDLENDNTIDNTEENENVFSEECNEDTVTKVIGESLADNTSAEEHVFVRSM